MKTFIALAAVTLFISLAGFSADIVPGSGPGSPSDHPFPPGARTPKNDWPTNMVHPHGNEMETNLPQITNNWPNTTNHWSTNDLPGAHVRTNHWPNMTNKWSNTNDNWRQTRTNRNFNPPSETR